ncbi:MAG: ABC transporter ATP-binding protein [Bacillota bacterium]
MQIKNLTFAYSEIAKIVDDVDLEFQTGKITTLIGANGCGKSTLLKLMSKNLPLQSGEIVIKGKVITDYSLREFAKELAVVHQKNTAPDDLTVKKLVAYGRIPHKHIMKTSHSKEDEEKITWAMEATDVLHLENRALGSLSGGQRQRVFIAMALAQDTNILFLDEPTTFLDVKYQVEVLRLVKRLNREFGITIVMVLHDMNQAISYSDEIVVLKNGKVYAQGVPKDVVTAKMIKEVYDIDLQVFENDGMVCVMAV